MNNPIKVTMVTPIVERSELAKKVINSFITNSNFPYIIKPIINPKLHGLIKWSKKKGFETVERLCVPIVKAKYLSVQICDTKYLFMMDSDMVIKNKLRPLYDLMEANSDVGVCSTALIGGHVNIRYGANLKKRDSILKVVPCKKELPLVYCNYVHNAATFFRKEIFNDVSYDIEYKGQGFAHEDLFMQLMRTKWKIVNYNSVVTKHTHTSVSRWYRKLRMKGVGANEKRFKKKWGYKVRY